MFEYGDQFARESAVWYPKNKVFDTFSPIAVENVSETRKSYNNISENMYGSGANITLRTRHIKDYSPPQENNIQHIKYRENWYEIAVVREVELGNLGFFHAKEFYLDLVEVAYGPDYASTD